MWESKRNLVTKWEQAIREREKEREGRRERKTERERGTHKLRIKTFVKERGLKNRWE